MLEPLVAAGNDHEAALDYTSNWYEGVIQDPDELTIDFLPEDRATNGQHFLNCPHLVITAPTYLNLILYVHGPQPSESPTFAVSHLIDTGLDRSGANLKWHVPPCKDSAARRHARYRLVCKAWVVRVAPCHSLSGLDV